MNEEIVVPASGTEEQKEVEVPVGTETPTPEELEAEKKVAELERQLLQAGHVIEELKKKPKAETPTYDEDDLQQKIQDGIDRALAERDDANAFKMAQARIEADANFKKLLIERDEALLSLRSKSNRSGGSGGGQRIETKPAMPEISQEELRFARLSGLPIEELIKSKQT